MDDPIILLVNTPAECEILIIELIETCFEGDLERILTAKKSVHIPTGPFYHARDMMRAQIFEVSLKKLQKISKPTIVELNTACTVYLGIDEEKRGSARSLLRRFVKDHGASTIIDKFMDDLELTIQDQEAMIGVRDIVASALIEANDAYRLWAFLRPAFREGYAGFDAWWHADRIKAKLKVLVILEPTSQIIEIVNDLIAELNTKFKDPFGGERWFREDPARAKWYKENIAKE
jgi:hypothetical protein